MGGIFHYKSPWKFGLHGVTSFPPCKHAATHLLGCFANTPCRPYLHGAVMLHTYIRADIHAYLLIYILTCLLTYIHTYILTYLHTYTLTYLHTYIRTNACIRPHMHTCEHTNIFTTFIYIYIEMYVWFGSSFHLSLSLFLSFSLYLYICMYSYTPHLHAALKINWNCWLWRDSEMSLLTSCFLDSSCKFHRLPRLRTIPPCKCYVNR